MARSYNRTKKRKSAAQLQNVKRATEVARQLSSQTKAIDNTSASQDVVQRLTKQAKALHVKYWNAQRRAHRLSQANAARKQENKQLKMENLVLRKASDRLTRDFRVLQADSHAEIQRINTKIDNFRAERQDHLKANKLLRRRQQRLCHRITTMKERNRISSRRGRIVSLMRKGAYTAQARVMARYLVKTGTAEKHVGYAIKHLGGMLGIEVNNVMSKRTVQRAILEEGVASDLQLGFEMAKSQGVIVLTTLHMFLMAKTQI